MNVVIYTFDLLTGREHLMPWRTIVEVAKYFKNQQNTNCIILNGSNVMSQHVRFFDDVKILSINKSNSTLVNYFQINKTDVIFYPMSVRDGLKKYSWVKDLNIKKIAYYPGGIYNFKGAISLWKISNFSTVKPYILETTIPKFLLLNKLKNSGFSNLVTMCAYSAKKLESRFWQKNVVSLPGNDDFLKINSNDSILEKYQLEECKFFLYTGSTAPIRGSIHLLHAFDKFAQKHQDAKLVMLLRKDVNNDSKSFQKAFENIKNKSQITIIHEMLNREQLKSFFSKAYAVILPFLLIPSEIPLTFFEVLSCGTPIITFKNGGTYEYIKQCSLGLSSRNTSKLAHVMSKLWNDEDLRRHLSIEAMILMEKHPSWEIMGKNWYNLI